MPYVGKFHRSEHAAIGGVCAGIAEYYDIDAVLVRVLAVLVTIITCGAGAIVYLVFLKRWPKCVDTAEPVDINPRSVDSSSFGRVEPTAAADASRRRQAEMPLCVGHEPPLPPSGFTGGARRQAAFEAEDAAALRSYALARTDGVPRAPAARARRNSISVTALIVFAFGVMTLVTCALANHYVQPMDFDACWPVFFIFMGIAIAVMPNGRYNLLWRVSAGVASAVVGLMLLLMSTHVLAWSSLVNAVVLLPFLLAVLAAAIAALVLESPGRALATNAGIVAFCLAVVFFFAIPGSVDAFTVALPFLPSFVVNVGFLVAIIV